MASPSVWVVLDGANVSTRKGGDRSIARLAAALSFFGGLRESRQCDLKCVAFVPNFWLNTKPTDQTKGNGSMETDDWELLKSLVDDELVVLTPSHAHDDFYVIDYAVKTDGFIVTNDMFRDHVENKRVFQGRRLTHKWVRARCIDFTFVGNEFLPNSQAIELVIKHIPQPKCPHGTLPAGESPRSSAASTTPVSTTPRPTKPTSMASTLRRSASQESSKKPPLDEEDGGGYDDDANAMSVDHVRKKNVDLSEMTAYRVPRHLVPLLHGDDGQTMSRFQDHTGTYIVVPNSAASPALTNNVATLTIYGAEPNRVQAVKILDAALPDLQRQFEFQQHQLWLQSQPQHFQPQHFPQHHEHQHQQLMDEARAYQLQQQHQQHQQQLHFQHQHQIHGYHPHYHRQADEHMEMDLE